MISAYNPLLYKDYTEILRKYFADEAVVSEDDNLNGMVRVKAELIEILSLYFELRVNAIYDTYPTFEQNVERALDNEWLRFCWYYRKHNEDNP